MTTLTKVRHNLIETFDKICPDGSTCQWLGELSMFGFCFSVIWISLAQIA